jgi:hypothetical protein
MACVNQKWLHCVNQMEKTQYKPLAAKQGRETTWKWCGMCDLALDCQNVALSSASSDAGVFRLKKI